MNRRTFTTGVGAWLAVPRAAESQQPANQSGRTFRVGLGFVVSEKVAERRREAFLAGLRDHGYVVGHNLVFDVRYADGKIGRLPALVDELLALKPDVLAGFDSVALIMKSKTSTIPIVLTHSSDPVAIGLAESIRRPGGNVTGIALLWDQLVPKLLEILRDIIPRLLRVALVMDTTFPGSKGAEDHARMIGPTIGAAMISYYFASHQELEKIFARMAQDRPDAAIFVGGGVLTNDYAFIMNNVRALKVPSCQAAPLLVPDPLLFGYGASDQQAYRDAARYVDHILKGANAGELPIEQPTRFELVVSLKAARALGLRIPPSVLLRADRVID